MPEGEVISHGQQVTGHHRLFTWAVPGFSAVRLAPDTLPCPHFACLLAADARAVSDAQLLNLADHLLTRGLAYFCAWGPDCERVHDLVDHAVVLRTLRDGRLPPVMTTWHAAESLEEAAWFLLNAAHPDPTLAPTCQARLGIAVANTSWAIQLQYEFKAAAGPSDTH